MAKIGKTLDVYSADTTSIPANDGFVVNGTGTMSIALRSDLATMTVYLLAGIHYSWDLKDVEVTAAEATTVIWVIRGMNQ
jgi:hypothetical protein